MSIFTPGERLGPFAVEGELGTGGMGVVYRAVDTRLDRAVAIKALPPRLAESASARLRFAREARAIAALSHPNVLVLHDIGLAGGTPYAVTELLEGRTLGERLRAGTPPLAETLAIAREVAEGLAAAHRRQIVHRDVKPDNVFLTDDGAVKLLDFGLAILGDGEETAGTPTDGSSASGVPMEGTLAYMSPEQAEGGEVGPASDVFSFGCVLYEMLAGRRAFPGAFGVALTRLVSGAPEPLPETTPSAVRELVARCLAKDPAERFADAGALRDALRALAADSRGTAPRTLEPSPLEPPPLEPPPAAAAAVARPPAAPASALGQLADAGRALVRRFRLWSGGDRPAATLAVLPLATTGDGAELEELADGVGERLVRELARRGERVLAWSSTRRLAAGSDPVASGRQLGVDAVVAGRLVRDGAHLRLTAERVDPDDGRCLWSGEVRRPAGAAWELAASLATLLTAPEGAASPSAASSGAASGIGEARRRYLLGRHSWNRRAAADLRRARSEFQAALEADPGFALAWSGLADAWAVLPFWGLEAPARAFPRARSAAEKALALAPDLAEALASRAYVAFYGDRDWPAARRLFAAAVAQDPAYATAHHWLGVSAALAGEADRAFAHLEKALDLDPLSPMIHADLALAYYLAGDAAQAERVCHDLIDGEPAFAPAHLYRAWARVATGDLPGGIASAERAVDLSGGTAPARACLAWARALHGETARAREILAALDDAAEGYVSAYPLAVARLAADGPEAALSELERALAEGCEALVWLRSDPRLASLRDTPRFQALVVAAFMSR